MELIRDRGRQRSRVLYVFRTVPGVKVGRDPFDPDTRRLLARANPDIAFDWEALIRSLPPPEAEPDTRRPIRRGRPTRRTADSRPAPRGGAAPREELVAGDDIVVPDAVAGFDGEVQGAADDVAPEAVAEELSPDSAGAADLAEGGRETAGERRRGAGPRFPTEVEGETVRSRLAWLRVWHAETAARIDQEITDEWRRQDLRRVVARLDPSSWSDEGAIEAGIADATAALRELAEVFDPDSRS